jgi:hypothetical protein
VKWRTFQGESIFRDVGDRKEKKRWLAEMMQFICHRMSALAELKASLSDGWKEV